MLILLIAMLMAPISLECNSREIVEGWVSDSACGARHIQPGGEHCVKVCLRGGGIAHPEWEAQQIVLVAGLDGKIWSIANPSGLAGFEGKHVRASVAKRRARLFVYSAVIVKESREP